MRPLTEQETKVFFEKLVKFIGEDIKRLLERDGEPYVFRLHRDRVYYVSETQLKLASNIPREKLMALGVMFGRFTKKKNFRLTVHCVNVLAQYAKHKVWVKPSSEMSFLYGHHVTKAGVQKITEGIDQYAGIVLFNSKDLPLGFGVASQSSEVIKSLEATAITILHQVDIGEYLRDEDQMN